VIISLSVTTMKCPPLTLPSPLPVPQVGIGAGRQGERDRVVC